MTHYFLIQTSIPQNCWLVHFQRGLIKRFNLEGKIKFSKRLKNPSATAAQQQNGKFLLLYSVGGQVGRQSSHQFLKQNIFLRKIGVEERQVITAHKKEGMQPKKSCPLHKFL